MPGTAWPGGTLGNPSRYAWLPLPSTEISPTCSDYYCSNWWVRVVVVDDAIGGTNGGGSIGLVVVSSLVVTVRVTGGGVGAQPDSNVTAAINANAGLPGPDAGGVIKCSIRLEI
jgi:hypothetical protein